MYKYLLVILFFSACSGSITKPDNSTDINCATNFIKSIYQGQFEEAKTIMLANKEDLECLNKTKFNYNQTITKALKEKYKKASIIIEKEIVSEDVSIIKYKNPVMNTTPPPLKLVKKGEEWFVVFSYSCSGNL